MPTYRGLGVPPGVLDAARQGSSGGQRVRVLRPERLQLDCERLAVVLQRLVEVAASRGHLVEVINTTRCYMNITSRKPEVLIGGHSLEGFDAIIPRIGASVTFYGMAVVRQFELMGVYCVNGAQAIGRSRDKLYAHQLLARQGLGMPTTAFAASPKDTSNLIGLVGSAPLIIKLLESTQGKGVVLAETKKKANEVSKKLVEAEETQRAMHTDEVKGNYELMEKLGEKTKYAQDVELLQSLALTGIEARMDYDAAYVRQKTEALAALPAALTSISSQQAAALRSSATKATSSLCYMFHVSGQVDGA